MKIFVCIVAAVLLSTANAGAVDCDMARKVAAGMSAAALKSTGTAEQRAQYRHCFAKPKAKKQRPK